MSTLEERANQAFLQKLRALENKQIARGEPKRARLDDDDDITDTNSLDVVSTFTACAIFIECENKKSLTSSEFTSIQNGALLDLIKEFFTMGEKDAIQDQFIISGLTIILFPSAAHRQTMMYINQFKSEARTIGGKVFAFREFSKDILKSFITIGTNLDAKELSETTKANLKALHGQIDADQWELQDFGSWEKDGLNFETYECNNLAQADAI